MRKLLSVDGPRLCGWRLQMVKVIFCVLVLAAVAILSGTPCKAQNGDHPFGFSVSELQKKEISERLVLASTYIRTKNWAKLYNLKWNDPDQRLSKMAFVAEMNVEPPEPDKIRMFVSFQPTGYIGIADQKNNENIMVVGCMVVIEHGKMRSYRASVDIGRRGSSEWLLLGLPILNPNYLAGGPELCPQMKPHIFLSTPWENPNEEQVAIQKRLDEMFLLLRAEKYEEVYKFLTGGNVGSKKEFVSRLRKDAAGVAVGKKDWYIEENFKLDGYFVFRDERKHEVVFLDGCLTVRTGDGIKSYSGAVRARRKGTKLWYFETLPAVNPNYMSSTGPVPCTASENDKK